MADDKCGCGSCTPSWIQWFANPKLFVFCFSILRIFDFGVRSYTNSALTIIERQFRLSSSESGLFAILNDVAQVSIIVFVSYFGYKYHRPRVIGTGFVITAIGFFMFAIPHFIEDPIDTSIYTAIDNSNQQTAGNQYSRIQKLICMSNDQSTSNYTSDQPGDCQSDNKGTAGGYGWPVLGQLLVGWGSAFTGPLMITYLADAVGKRRLLLYLAFQFIGSTFGVIFGLILNSYTNSKYVDFDRLDPDEIPDIPQNDARWIGAWWLGYIIGGVPMLFLSIPIFFFPRTMHPPKEDTKPEADELNSNGTKEKQLIENQNKDIIDVVRKKAAKEGFKEVLRGLLPALKRVCTNVPLWLMIFSGIFKAAFIAAIQSNLTKFLVYQYNFSVSRASLFLIAIVPLTIFAHFITAGIIRRHKYNAKQCMLMLTVLKWTGAACFFGVLFTGCPTIDVAGYTVPYNDTNTVSDSQMIPLCNADCSCNEDDFFPVCANNGITYTSPCHAGCTAFNMTRNENNNKLKPVFSGCHCFEHSEDNPGTATSGFCPLETGCKNYYFYILLLFVSMFLAAMTIQLFTYAVLCVSAHDDRAISLGFEDAIPKVVGNLPAPVYVGAIINSTCKLWQTTCGERGNCYIFDMDKYRLRFHGLLLVFIVLSGLFTAICYCVLPSKKKEEDQENDTGFELMPNTENGTEITSNGANQTI